MGRDQDDAVVLPLRTLQRRVSGSQDVGQIQVAVKDGVATDRVKAAIEQLMRERRRVGAGETDDFNVLDTKEIAQAMTGTTQLLTTLLGAVAAVSLLVGGIGIMNIMLVSITERTREIGLRLAIGALEREVLLQFLIEAVTLSMLGGVIGIALATAASIVLAQVMQVPYLFNPAINLLSFAVSAVIGVVFGYFPARRAAHLDRSTRCATSDCALTILYRPEPPARSPTLRLPRHPRRQDFSPCVYRLPASSSPRSSPSRRGGQCRRPRTGAHGCPHSHRRRRAPDAAASVVHIVTTGYRPVRGTSDATTPVVRRQSLAGSGVVIDDGLIATTSALLAGADEVLVTLPSSGGRRARSVRATLAGLAPEVGLALLRVEAASAVGLRAVAIASPANISRGLSVFTLRGDAAGALGVTPTTVEAVALSVEPMSATAWIQTPAAPRADACGGPVVMPPGARRPHDVSGRRGRRGRVCDSAPSWPSPRRSCASSVT
jgi:hypothetical protein